MQTLARNVHGSALLAVMLVGSIIGVAAYLFSQSLVDRKRESEATGLTMARNTVVQRFEAILGVGLNSQDPSAFKDALVIHHSRVDAGNSQNIVVPQMDPYPITRARIALIV